MDEVLHYLKTSFEAITLVVNVGESHHSRVSEFSGAISMTRSHSLLSGV